MTRLTALALIALLCLSALPATAAQDVNQPCANSQGLPLVTVAEGQRADIDTPIGAVVSLQSVEGGTYLVDLAGEPVGTTKTVDVVLSWTNGVIDETSDYDMIVNGVDYRETGATEIASLTLGHCKKISVDEVYAWTGTPADTLTLDLSISSWSF